MGVLKPSFLLPSSQFLFPHLFIFYAGRLLLLLAVPDQSEHLPSVQVQVALPHLQRLNQILVPLFLLVRTRLESRALHSVPYRLKLAVLSFWGKERVALEGALESGEEVRLGCVEVVNQFPLPFDWAE